MVAWYPRSSSSVELRSQPGWLMVRPTEPRGCMIPLGSVQHLGHGSPLKPLAVSFDLLFPMKKQGGCLSLIFLRACFPASSLLPSLCSQSSSHVFQFSRHICNIYQYIYIYTTLCWGSGPPPIRPPRPLSFTPRPPRAWAAPRSAGA